MTAYRRKTPLGTAKITGDVHGIASISILEEGDITIKIPKELKKAVTQLEDYFKGKRTQFDFKTQPQGTEFQQKVWQALLEIPYGKTVSYMDITKKLGDVKAIRRPDQ